MSKEIDYIGGLDTLLRCFNCININDERFEFWKEKYFLCVNVIEVETKKLENSNFESFMLSLEQIAINLERLKQENLKSKFMLEEEIGYFNTMCEIINRLYSEIIIKKI